MNRELTQTELKILRLVSQGLTNIEISDICLIKPCTVRNHIATVYRKLKIKNRVQARIKYEHYEGMANGTLPKPMYFPPGFKVVDMRDKTNE